jgi:hypothetical protein
VERPRRLCAAAAVASGTAEEPEAGPAGVVGLEDQLQAGGPAVFRQHQRGGEGHVLDVEAAGPQEFLRGAPGHLQVGRGGEHRRAVDAVLVEPMQGVGAELLLPEVVARRGGRGEVESQERMGAASGYCGSRASVALPLAQAVEPEALTLPGIGRQLHLRQRSRIEPPPVHRVAMGVERGQRAAQHRRLLLVAQHRRQDEGLAVEVAEDLADGAAENGVRSDLEEGPMLAGDEVLDGLREAERLAQVLRPVAGVQLFAPDLGTGHRRHQPHRRGPRCEAGKGRL